MPRQARVREPLLGCSDQTEGILRGKDFLETLQFYREEWLPRGPDQEVTTKRDDRTGCRLQMRIGDSEGCGQTEVSLQGQKALANLFFLNKLQWLVRHCASWLPTWPAWLYKLQQSHTWWPVSHAQGGISTFWTRRK